MPNTAIALSHTNYIFVWAGCGSFRAKSRKGIAQARALIDALCELRPHELEMAIDDARGRGPKWAAALKRTLDANGDIAQLLDTL